jgi:hypothetical protein
LGPAACVVREPAETCNLRSLLVFFCAVWARPAAALSVRIAPSAADNGGDSDEARVLRLLQAAACTYRIAFGPRAEQKVLTIQGAMPRDADFKQRLCADIDGFSLHAAVRCGADERHPLARRRGSATFDDLLRYSMASTPLSDEVARVLVERYGTRVHPSQCVTLRCDEIPSLVEVTRRSDAVLLAIRADAPDLVELRLKPALDATARFGLVTLARRTEPAGLAPVRDLMEHLLRDPALAELDRPVDEGSTAADCSGGVRHRT